ncbi:MULTISPECIES: hypothetical protein [unclassified Pseudomonas]|uniref:AMP-dependent synthetase/ligase domain-containing protein n=1 Tax=Pseudomonas sp. MYb327 TaxID=2745230 RepID=A0AAU8E0A9_9PSED
MQVLILDDDFQPVIEQTVGELYIVGPGVCLGYLNNPQQTAERYLTLNMPDGEYLRAYRTGDMAKSSNAHVSAVYRSISIAPATSVSIASPECASRTKIV